MAKNNPAQIVLKNVRFAYVHVFEKDEMNDKYSVRILIPKNSPQLGDIKACIAAACAAGSAKLGGKQIPWNKVLHDGDIEVKGEDHAGHYYLNAKSTNKPGVVKVNPTGIGGKTMAITDESEFYSGCYGWADVGFFAFNQGVNKGISVALNNLMKTRDGDPLGSAQSAEADFGQFVEDDDDLPPSDAPAPKKTPTEDDARQAVKAARSRGVPAKTVKDLMRDSFNIASSVECPAERRQELIDALNQLAA